MDGGDAIKKGQQLSQPFLTRKVNMKTLEHQMTEMYNIANRLVGWTGPSTITSASVTEEPYITFGLQLSYAKNILDIWTKWIESYIEYATYKKPEMYPTVQYGDIPKMTIYWRKKPVIEYECVKARLLISYCKANPDIIPITSQQPAQS